MYVGTNGSCVRSINHTYLSAIQSKSVYDGREASSTQPTNRIAVSLFRGSVGMQCQRCHKVSDAKATPLVLRLSLTQPLKRRGVQSVCRHIHPLFGREEVDFTPFSVALIISILKKYVSSFAIYFQKLFLIIV